MRLFGKSFYEAVPGIYGHELQCLSGELPSGAGGPAVVGDRPESHRYCGELRLPQSFLFHPGLPAKIWENACGIQEDGPHIPYAVRLYRLFITVHGLAVNCNVMHTYNRMPAFYCHELSKRAHFGARHLGIFVQNAHENASRRHRMNSDASSPTA